MWDKPVAKYWSRVLRIAALNLPAYLAILAYTSYAISCHEYLCQMHWAPPSLLKLEARAISRILKIPSYAFGVDGPFQLKNYGILSCRSILTVNLAAMFRASRVTLDGWQCSWSLLLDSVNTRHIDTAQLHTLSPPSGTLPP